jgi:hypothetical protein
MNPVSWKCPRSIGFLFPHECDRPSPVGCPDCNNGQVSDPFRQRTDRYEYNDYDNYSGVAGVGLAGLALGSAHDNFTEADGESLVRPRKRFEEDMSAS